MRSFLLALPVVLVLTAPAGAQDTGATTATPQTPPAVVVDQVKIDASKLGVSMNRIRRGLRVSEAREEASSDSPLKLNYQVQVYGAAPRIDIIQDFDIGKRAPLQYGAPTHQDFINQWTPQAYRAPRMPISSLAGWALFQMVKRNDKSKCEQEIADYRAAVMQGISMSAPRCTQ